MTKGTTRPLEIPKEMRAVTEQSVEQSKLAFNNYLRAAQEAVSSFDQWVKASQVGTQGLCNKAMNFAQCNVLSAFESRPRISRNSSRRRPSSFDRRCRLERAGEGVGRGHH